MLQGRRMSDPTVADFASYLTPVRSQFAEAEIARRPAGISIARAPLQPGRHEHRLRRIRLRARQGHGAVERRRGEERHVLDSVLRPRQRSGALDPNPANSRDSRCRRRSSPRPECIRPCPRPTVPSGSRSSPPARSAISTRGPDRHRISGHAAAKWQAHHRAYHPVDDQGRVWTSGGPAISLFDPKYEEF